MAVHTSKTQLKTGPVMKSEVRRVREWGDALVHGNPKHHRPVLPCHTSHKHYEDSHRYAEEPVHAHLTLGSAVWLLASSCDLQFL